MENVDKRSEKRDVWPKWSHSLHFFLALIKNGDNIRICWQIFKLFHECKREAD